MKDEKIILQKIIEGIQEKKGKHIAVVNLTKLPDAPCGYFIITEGDSSTQVSAIGTSIKDYVRDKIKVKPYATDGFDNCEWIAMDYGLIIVHVFQRHIRSYYNIEHLWSDAQIELIEDIF